MNEQIIKNTYIEIEKSLKGKSNELYLNSESEIRSICTRITEKIENVLQYNDIVYDANKLEQLVSDELRNSLINDSKSLYTGNYQVLNNFNNLVQNFLVSEQKKEYEKEKKMETIDGIISKFDYAMNEYKNKKINSYESFNNFFRQALKALPLYDRQDVVEQIKNVLDNELKYYDNLQFDSRNKIIKSNIDKILENISMVKNTDMKIEPEKVSYESINYVESQYTEINNNFDKNVQQAEKDLTNQDISMVKNTDMKIEPEKVSSEQFISNVPKSKEIGNNFEKKSSQVQQEKQDYITVNKENILQKELDAKIVDNIKKEENITKSNDFEEEKMLYAPRLVSNEEAIMNQVKSPVQQMEVKDNYQILNDGTIVRNGPAIQQLYQSTENSYDVPPTLVSNENKLIEVVKQNLTDHVWQEIGISASKMDKNIDSSSNDMLNRIDEIMTKNGIQSMPQLINIIINELNTELKEINNNLSTNMIKLFENVNAETVDSVSQALIKPEETKNQDIEQSLQVYINNTSVKEYRLTCEKQFNDAINNICMQNGIRVDTPAYQELNRMLTIKKTEMEQDFFRMYDDFSQNNASYMYTTIKGMSSSYENIKGMQEKLNQQQIQSLLLYNKEEYEKNYYNEMAQAQLEELNGFSR